MNTDQEQLRRLHHSLRMVNAPFPHFAGLARAVRLVLDERVPTMGVFASGRLVVNPGFARRLSDRELVFVLAHELFHLALRTHDRAAASDPLRFNVAHDYIINDILRDELGFAQVPAGGLDWPGARRKSAEEILLEMEQDPGKGVSDAAQKGQSGDVLNGKLECEWFPGDDADQQALAEAMRQAAARALSLGQALAGLKGKGRGADPGAAPQQVTALRGLYRIPWQTALQRWLESVAPGERTFLRPSRRGQPAADVVLPGRQREGWLLNIVLDTSGSMADEIPRALGAIADIADALAVDQVRLVQCDTEVTDDELLSPAELAEHRIAGYGGSDLSPALRHLAEDERVRAVVVLTDGDIAYPQEKMPYAVLWLLSANAVASFRPTYGQVLAMEPAESRTQAPPGYALTGRLCLAVEPA